MGARPHGRGRVCGWHREHTFFSPADFLGDWRRGRRNLWHFPEGPSPEEEVLLSNMRDVVSRIPAPRVSHLFDVERGEVLSGWLYRQRRELNARDSCLVGDELHFSRVKEKGPPPINVGVVISHGVLALLGSLAATSPSSADRISPSSASAAADSTSPTALSYQICLSCCRHSFCSGR